MLNMIWTAFEIAINIFQGYLLLMYVKQCFTYEKKHPIADVLLVCSCAGFLCYFLFFDYILYMDYLLFLFPTVYAFLFSSERKISIAYWIAVLIIIFGLVPTTLLPIFNLIPTVLRHRLPFQFLERFLCTVISNIILLIALKGIIYLKKSCPPSGTSSYIAFLVTLGFAFLVVESLFSIFNEIGTTVKLPFLLACLGMIAITIMSFLLFRIISFDTERKNHLQTEITMLSLTKQHQHELSQMYETLTARQHDYKHHLQTLTQLVSSSSSTAKEYLDSITKEAADEDMIITGSPEVDALLTVKRRIMREKGIEFKLTPYPLANLPITTTDFCAILGNLLDNAIEGIQRIAEPPANPLIHLTFSRSWDMFYVYCTNPCEPSTLVEKKGLFLTSKKKSEPGLHGIGLHSIEAIAERAEGRTEFHTTDNEFHAKVVLPFLKNAKKSE